MITDTKKAGVMFDILQAILSTVRESGPAGAPASMLFLALSAHGCTLPTFQALMGILIESGKVRFGSDCRYFSADGKWAV